MAAMGPQSMGPDWAVLMQTLEQCLSDHLQKQEKMMNQHAERVETIISASTGIMSPRVAAGPVSSSRPSVAALAEACAEDRRVSTTRVDVAGKAQPSSGTASSPKLAVPRVSTASGVSEWTSEGYLKSQRVSMVSSQGDASTTDNNGDGLFRLSMSSVSPFEPQVMTVESYRRRRMLSLRLQMMRTALGDTCWLFCGDCLDWWMELQEPPREGRLARFVRSKWLELLCTLVIATNGVVTVYSTNAEAASLSVERSQGLRTANMCFVAFYTVELLLKLAVHRLFFFCNADMAWNIFDGGLVALAIFDLVYFEVTMTESVNMSHMRTMRITMRIMRSAKVLRMFRLIRFFSELRLMLNSVVGSFLSLFWSIVMLTFMFFIFAIVFVQGSTMALINEDLSMELQVKMRETLGSTQAAMLMLYQSTTGGENWTHFYDLILQTGVGNAVLYLFFIAFSQLALLNILTGIFVENAMKLARPDRDTAALQHRKQDLSEADELRRLCMSVDVQGTGFISERQFMDQMKNDQFRARLALLGLDIKHAALFFDVVCQDNQRKRVEIEAFVSAAMRLRGMATSFDLQTLTLGTKLIHENQLKLLKGLEDLGVAADFEEPKVEQQHAQLQVQCKDAFRPALYQHL